MRDESMEVIRISSRAYDTNNQAAEKQALMPDDQKGKS